MPIQYPIVRGARAYLKTSLQEMLIIFQDNWGGSDPHHSVYIYIERISTRRY